MAELTQDELKKLEKVKSTLPFDERCKEIVKLILQASYEANITPFNSVSYIKGKFGQILELYREASVSTAKDIMLRIFEDFKAHLDKANEELKGKVKEVLEEDIGKGKKVEELDLTEQRNRKCIPIVEKIVDEVFYKKFLTFDREYFEERVDDVLSTFYKGYPVDAYNEIMGLFIKSINKGFEEAQKILWKGKDQDEVTMQDMEEVLKLAVPEPTEQKKEIKL